MKPIKPKKMPKALERWIGMTARSLDPNATLTINRARARSILAALEYERQRAEEHAKVANEATRSVLRLTHPVRTGADFTPEEQRAFTEAVIPQPRKSPEIEASYARERNIERRTKKKLTAR